MDASVRAKAPTRSQIDECMSALANARKQKNNDVGFSLPELSNLNPLIKGITAVNNSSQILELEPNQSQPTSPPILHKTLQIIQPDLNQIRLAPSDLQIEKPDKTPNPTT
ncbi:hypothetical protein Droror1_Dr00018224 [Drosera rotundifolia]